jgi:hypothetical protein
MFDVLLIIGLYIIYFYVTNDEIIVTKLDKTKDLIDYGDVVLAKFIKDKYNNRMKLLYGIVLDKSDRCIILFYEKNITIKLSRSQTHNVLSLKEKISKENPTCTNDINNYYLYLHDFHNEGRGYVVPKNEKKGCVVETLKSYLELNEFVIGLNNENSK